MALAQTHFSILKMFTNCSTNNTLSIKCMFKYSALLGPKANNFSPQKVQLVK